MAFADTQMVSYLLERSLTDPGGGKPAVAARKSAVEAFIDDCPLR